LHDNTLRSVHWGWCGAHALIHSAPLTGTMLSYSDTLTEGGVNTLILSDPLTGGGVNALGYSNQHSPYIQLYPKDQYSQILKAVSIRAPVPVVIVRSGTGISIEYV
jgi:hypothetical protein